MTWKIEYPYEDVERFILKLQPTLAARYFRITDLMIEFGSNLGLPHTRPLSKGLFELRIKGKEGIARLFYCTLADQRIVMLHGFIKKSRKTPRKEIQIAWIRIKEVKENETR